LLDIALAQLCKPLCQAKEGRRNFSSPGNRSLSSALQSRGQLEAGSAGNCRGARLEADSSTGIERKEFGI